MKGRKPKPTKIKILEGNRGKRPLPENEPRPQPVAPECPDWLCEEAKEEWNRVAPPLERLGLLTEIDMTALVGYCEAWADYKKAKKFIQKHGEVYPIKTNEGEVKYLQQVPQVAIANRAMKLVQSLCAEFGMTPSARGRMSIKGADNNDDEMENLLRGG